MGNIYKHQKQYEDAVSCYEKAVQMSKNHTEFLQNELSKTQVKRTRQKIKEEIRNSEIIQANRERQLGRSLSDLVFAKQIPKNSETCSKATEHFENAKKFYEKYNVNHSEMIEIFIAISDLHFFQKKYQLGEEVINQAIDLFKIWRSQQIQFDEPPESILNQNLLFQKGLSYMYTEQNTLAIDAFNSSLVAYFLNVC